MLLGAGGASRAIIAGFAKEHAKKITIINRTMEKASDLAEFGESLGLKSNVVPINDMENMDGCYDFIINASSFSVIL